MKLPISQIDVKAKELADHLYYHAEGNLGEITISWSSDRLSDCNSMKIYYKKAFDESFGSPQHASVSDGGTEITGLQTDTHYTVKVECLKSDRTVTAYPVGVKLGENGGMIPFVMTHGKKACFPKYETSRNLNGLFPTGQDKYKS